MSGVANAPDTWFVQAYSGSQWYHCAHQGDVRSWPLEEAIRLMLKDWNFWHRQYADYQVRLFNPKTGEVIPREAL